MLRAHQASPRWRRGKKNGYLFWAHIYAKNRSFYQDRLGTNIAGQTSQNEEPLPRMQLFGVVGREYGRLGRRWAERGKTTVLCVRFYLTMIIFPRQARDKHREISTQKRLYRFLAGGDRRPTHNLR
jgi:hypothetical protein